MQNVDLIEKFDIGQEEIFNTKMIAWLLNPKENHNYGSAFLEDFLFLINEKNILNNDISIKINHDAGYFGKIDILLETKSSVYAVKCGNMDDLCGHESIYTYKDYLSECLKSDKKTTAVYICAMPTHLIKLTQ